MILWVLLYMNRIDGTKVTDLKTKTKKVAEAKSSGSNNQLFNV